MLKKTIIILFLLLMLGGAANAAIEVYFIYKGAEYTVFSLYKESAEIDPFDALKEIDQSQTHRLLLTSLEKSRLLSLFFVGDKLIFNGIELQLINNDKYQITDINEGINIIFTLGYYDNIIIESALNFREKEINIIDKLATSFTVKIFLNKMLNKVRIKNETRVSNFGQEELKITEEYIKFIDQLKLLKQAEALNYITKYAELNFKIDPTNDITKDWITPSKLYYFKEGDYKSLAFFYYYTLRALGFKVRSYLVSDLLRKSDDDIRYMHDLFMKKYKPSENLSRIQEIELQYKHVNQASNLKSFFYDYQNNKQKAPPALFFFYPPDFKKSIFLTALEFEESWIYTTGSDWIKSGIKDSPERTCSHFARNGCYYSYFEKDFAILNNIALNDTDIVWDIYYGTK